MSDSEEEEFTFEDEEEKVASSPAKKSKAVAKRPSTSSGRSRPSKVTSYAMDEDDEDEEEDDYEASPVKKKSKKAKAAAVKSVSKKKKKKRPAADSDNDDDEEDTKPKAKKPKPDAAPSSSSAASKKSKSSSTTTSSTAKQRELKKLDRSERLQYAIQSFLWWNAQEPPEGCQWSTMEHAGVSFPEPYEPHGIPVVYNGQPVPLTPVQEEAVTFFAGMDPEGMHLGNPKTAPIFIKNFFTDFKALLGKKHVIQDFKKLNVDNIRNYLNEQKIIKKAITDEQRRLNKEDRNQALFRFGFAIVDGHLERVGNYNMEPPGTFRGRGAHPKMGKLKQRVLPEQVSLNLSECAAVPVCPVPGHAWGDVRHDPRGQWLATWKENINNQSKYMQLAAQSSFKGKSDRSKYSKAALLCGANIEKIRKSCKKDLKAKSSETKQLATAVWVIDRLSLRVGGEKDTDEEADTVGCCSLRVEHLHFHPNGENDDDDDDENREIELEFLGKDSMLYKQTIDFAAPMYNDNNGMGKQVFDNLKSFCKRKKPSDQVFESITPTMMNMHLKQFMDGLSAKVFRTYNASKTLQDELRKAEQLKSWKNLSAAEKTVEYNNANREVAILCNHQRSVSKAQETQLENISGKIATLKKQKKVLKGILKKLTAGDKDDIPLKKSQEAMTEAVQKALDKAKKMKEGAKSNADKIAAQQADEKAKQKKRDLADHKFQTAHLWEKAPNSDQVAKRIENWSAKISKMEMDLKQKDDNKEVSLVTSKINYMDPRITVAWCKRNEVPIEKVFPKTLRDKFNWAMAVPAEWEFNASVAKLG